MVQLFKRFVTLRSSAQEVPGSRIIEAGRVVPPEDLPLCSY
jgi:hypothetical protein